MEIDILASGSSGNCYRVSDGKTSLLLDCGIPIRRIERGLNFQLHTIDAVLVTHCHQDHIKAAKDIAKRGIPIYTSAGTLNACKLLAGYQYRPVQSMEMVQIGTFAVIPFDVEHDAPEPLGFALKSSVTKEKLLYFTDTYYLKYRFPGIHYLMAECNYSLKTMSKDINPVLRDRIIESHMSLETLLELLQANEFRELKQVYLLHLSSDNSDAELFKTEVQKAAGVEVYVC